MKGKAAGPALPDEAQWVTRAQSGDKEAYRRLVEAYQDRLHGLVLSMVPAREQAEDLTQEILVKAYFALPRFNFGSAFYTWLFRIGANHCLDHLRKKRPPEVSIDAPISEEEDTSRGERLMAPESEGPSAPLERESESYRILQSLSPEQRLILSLRELEGYSYEDIAKELNCGVNTIKSRLNRARAALKEAYEARYRNVVPQKSVEELGKPHD
jgi:RNA polymerase sigma-70 factor, ECF subfamily